MNKWIKGRIITRLIFIKPIMKVNITRDMY